MIRLAVDSDIESILPLAKKFLSDSPLADKTTIDDESLSSFLSGFILSDDSAVWVLVKSGLVVGMSGAVMFPFYANESYKIAQELFWYVDKNHRGEGGKLLESMEKWAKASGAKSMHMISLETPSAKVMDRYYKRSGYTPIEHTYSKEL